MATPRITNWKVKIAGASRTPNGYAGRGPSRFTDERNAWGFTPNHEDAEYLGFYVRMKREKFLRLAFALPEWKKNQAVGKHMDSGGSVATPMLYLKIPEGWLKEDFSQPAEVVGHEGRNRVTALPPHTVENVIIIPKYLRARNITPRMIEEIDRRLYTENDDHHAKRLEYDNLVKDTDRTPNVGGVRIPAYLRTPKLKPYIEQGLITQEIVDLYEEAFEQMNLYLDLAEEKRKRMSDFGITYAEVHSHPRTAGFDEKIVAHYLRVYAIYDELLQEVSDLPPALGRTSRVLFPYLGYRGYNEPDDMNRHFTDEIMKSLIRSRKK